MSATFLGSRKKPELIAICSVCHQKRLSSNLLPRIGMIQYNFGGIGGSLHSFGLGTAFEVKKSVTNKLLASGQFFSQPFTGFSHKLDKFQDSHTLLYMRCKN